MLRGVFPEVMAVGDAFSRTRQVSICQTWFGVGVRAPLPGVVAGYRLHGYRAGPAGDFMGRGLGGPSLPSWQFPKIFNGL